MLSGKGNVGGGGRCTRSGSGGEVAKSVVIANSSDGIFRGRSVGIGSGGITAKEPGSFVAEVAVAQAVVAAVVLR